MQAEQMMFSFDSSGNLILPAAHSPGFVSGSTGWSLKNDGSAEFNNVTIRGGTVVSGTALYYNGAPAAGNLIASISAAAGTDAFGNTYPQGIAVKNSGQFHVFNSSGTEVTTIGGANGDIVCTDGTITVRIGSGVMEFWQNSAPADKSLIFSGGHGFVTFQSGKNTGIGNTDQATAALISGPPSTKSPNGPSLFLQDSAGNSMVDIFLSGAVLPISVTGAYAIPQWQGPVYNASWGGLTNFNAVTPVKALAYRLTVQDDTWIYGAFSVTGAGAGATVFQLTAGYYDATVQSPFTVLEKTAAGVWQTGLGYVSSAGNFHIDLAQNFTRNAGDIFFVNARIPRGNIT